MIKGPEVRSSWVNLVGPNPNDKCPFLRHSEGTENKGENSWAAGEAETYVSTSPRTGRPQRPGEAEKTLSGASGGSLAPGHLDLGLLASRT